MKKMGKFVYKIFMIIYAIAILVVFISAANTNKESLLIIVSGLIGFLVLLNFIYVIVNISRVKSVKLTRNGTVSTNLHPLELYLVDCIWNNKKKKFYRRQIYGSLLYEIECGNLIYTGGGIKISPDVNIEKLSVYTMITLEMSLLDRIGCRKVRRLKIHDLKELQKDDAAVIMEDLIKNIDSNCQDVDLFNEQMNIIKKEYFKEIEGKKTVYLSLVSWLCVFVSPIFMIKNINNGDILNLYLPVGLAVILVATLTSKYRERVVIKKTKKEFISEVLNYIEYLNTAKNNKIDEIYGHCLEKRDSGLISIFK